VDRQGHLSHCFKVVFNDLAPCFLGAIRVEELGKLLSEDVGVHDVVLDNLTEVRLLLVAFAEHLSVVLVQRVVELTRVLPSEVLEKLVSRDLLQDHFQEILFFLDLLMILLGVDILHRLINVVPSQLLNQLVMSRTPGLEILEFLFEQNRLSFNHGICDILRSLHKLRQSSRSVRNDLSLIHRFRFILLELCAVVQLSFICILVAAKQRSLCLCLYVMVLPLHSLLVLAQGLHKTGVLSF
jgi:hypothetical protein